MNKGLFWRNDTGEPVILLIRAGTAEIQTTLAPGEQVTIGRRVELRRRETLTEADDHLTASAPAL